jgi:PKD repeat protein
MNKTNWALLILFILVAGGGVWAYQYSQNSNTTQNETANTPVNSDPIAVKPAPQVKASFSASPQSGGAPLTVHFSQNITDDWRAIIDYGDNTACGAGGGGANVNCSNTFVHTYTAPGMYTAKLYSSTGTDGASRPPLGTATVTVTGGSVATCPTANGDSSPSNIKSITPSSGPVGTTIKLTGCNFRGFEGDTNLWFTNSSGVKGVLNGGMNNSNSLITATLPAQLCTVDNSYSGLPCPSYMDLTPGTYSVTESGYGASNSVTFTVTL